MNTHRAYAGADTTITCWVRDASGAVNLASAELDVEVYAYGQSTPLVTLAGEGNAAGRVQFDITSDQPDLSPGLYRFAVKAGGAVVYGGLLEIV